MKVLWYTAVLKYGNSIEKLWLYSSPIRRGRVEDNPRLLHLLISVRGGD